MIPKKIQIKNFLSYGSEPQTIDFEPYSLICLSGKNGHGKSALLDAITWAVWGQARKTGSTSKADEGLVHLGQKHMLVIFDFEINGENYRIRREFVKTQSHPFSALDFGIVKGDDSFTTLTDKTIKATQDKLEKTIGITYESFINSAFLRQGQANEFSKKSPKERKEILATILQLDRFEDLKKVALEKTKHLQQKLNSHQSIYTRITDEINDLKTALQEIDAHLAQLATVEQQEVISCQQLIIDEQKKELLLDQQKKYEFIQLQIADHKKQLTDIESAIHEINTKYEAVAIKQKDAVNINALKEQQKQLQELIASHQEKLNKRLELKDQYLNLQEEKQRVENIITQQTTILTQQHDADNKKIDDAIVQQRQLLQFHEKKQADDQKEIDTLKNNLERNQKLLEQKQSITTTLADHEASVEKNKQLYQAVKTESALIEQKLADIAQKTKFPLENQDPSCPLCEQNLSISRKKFLEQKFIKEQIAAQELLQKTIAEIKLLDKQLAQDQTILQAYIKDVHNFTKLISQTDEIQNQLTKLLSIDAENSLQISIIIKNITELEKDLVQLQVNQKKSIAVSLHSPEELLLQTLIKKIDVLKQTGQKLGYNKEMHEKDYKDFQAIELQLASYQNLQTEIAQQEQRLQQINALLIQKSKIVMTIDQCSQEFEAMKTVPTQLTEHTSTMMQHKQDLQKILVQKTDLLNKKAVFDLQSKKLLSIEQEQTVIEKEITSVSGEIADFAEIVKALGKDGLQALLIEQALPEIEQEANILLAQLTDNQTQIYIESLRDLKKGGSKETLDIKISDEIGLRPYEMFSGGEAFRIDFALRIAISKLLARRAGTSLQTLIIDEGFGSQDDDGLQLIMDSILKIRDNFAKVIIVSHLPSMKDQFPVQFLVQKKASGSVITVIEQG